MKILYFFLCLLFFIPCVLAFEPRVECLNNTYLQWVLIWDECNPTCTSRNITQVTNCTNGCDMAVNQCKYIRKSEIGDIVPFIGVTFTTGMFFFLGMRVQPSEEFSMFKNGLQTFFFIVGFWILLLDMGLAETIGVSSGVSRNTLNLIESTITILSYAVYIVMVLLFLSYLVSVVWLLLPNKKRE